MRSHGEINDALQSTSLVVEEKLGFFFFGLGFYIPRDNED
jgi:hypothetical protein